MPLVKKGKNKKAPIPKTQPSSPGGGIEALKKVSLLANVLDGANRLKELSKPSPVVQSPIKNIVNKATESIAAKGKNFLNNAMETRLLQEAKGQAPKTSLNQNMVNHLEKNGILDKVNARIAEFRATEKIKPLDFQPLAVLSPEGDDTKKSFLEKYLGRRGNQSIDLNSLTLGAPKAADAFKQDRIQYADYSSLYDRLFSLGGIKTQEEIWEANTKGNKPTDKISDKKDYSGKDIFANNLTNQIVDPYDALLPQAEKDQAIKGIKELIKLKDKEMGKDLKEFGAESVVDEVASFGLGPIFGGVKKLGKFGKPDEWPTHIKDMYKGKQDQAKISKNLLDALNPINKVLDDVVAKAAEPASTVTKVNRIERKLDTKSMGLEDSPTAKALEKYKAPQPYVSQNDVKVMVKGKQYGADDIIALAQNIWDNPKTASINLETQEIVRNTYNTSVKAVDDITKKLALDPTNDDLAKQFTNLAAKTFELSNAVKMVKGVSARLLSLQKTTPGQVLKDDIFLQESKELLSTLPKESADEINVLLHQATLKPMEVIKDKNFLIKADEIIAKLPEDKAQEVKTLLTKAQEGAQDSLNFIQNENFLKATSAVLKNLPKDEAIKLNQKLLAAKGDPIALKKIIDQNTKTTWKGKTEEYMMAALLSNPKTHVKNIMGSVMSIGTKLARMPFEAGIDMVQSAITGKERKYFFGEIPKALGGLAKSIPEATREVGRDLIRITKGESVQQVKQGDIGFAPQIKGIKGDIIRVPLSMLAVEDKFFKKLVGDMETARWNVKTSKGNTSSVKKIGDEIEQETLEALFQKELGFAGKPIQNLVNDIPGLKLFFPFLKTPLNIVKEGIKHTPLGFAQAIWKRGDDIPKEMSKAIVGTAMSIPVISWATGDDEKTGLPNMTGAAPTSEAERDAFYRMGLMPYSIRLPGTDKYVSYKDMEPFSILLSTANKAAEGYKKSGEVNSDLLLNMATEMGRTISDKSSMKSLGEFVDVFLLEGQTTIPERLSEVAIGKVGQFFPNVVGAFGRGMDETIREPSGAKEQLQALIPFLNQKLDAKTDLFGNDMKKLNGFAGQTILPVTIASTENFNMLDQELLRLKTPVGAPSRNVLGVELDKKSYNQMKKVRGTMLQSALAGVMFNDEGTDYREEWTMLPDSMKAKFIKDAETKIDKQASIQFFVDNPDSVQKSLSGSKKNQIKLMKELVPLLDPSFREFSPGQLDEYINTNIDALMSNYQARVDEGLLGQDLQIAQYSKPTDYAKQ